MDTPWSEAPGVIVMPDGTRFRGRGLRRAEPEGEDPTFALYLLGAPPSPPQKRWETTWLDWPDFRLPRHPAEAVAALRDAHRRGAFGRVEIACGGGKGRTGTALSCIAVLAGVPAADAVAFVRASYDRCAVESPFQRRFVRRFPQLVDGSA
jgi:protein-tyrosine phosphatase